MSKNARAIIENTEVHIKKKEEMGRNRERRKGGGKGRKREGGVGGKVHERNVPTFIRDIIGLIIYYVCRCIS